jgi:hypothetical protein
MNNLALGYRAAGKLNLALPLFEETLRLMEAKLGPDHPDTLISMHNLAEGYSAAGKLDLALPLSENALKLMKAKLGPDHPHTLACMANLAVGYQAAGKLDLALPLYQDTLKLRKAKLGPDHPDTLSSMANLARGYRAVGKLDLALPLFEETLTLMRAKLGPDHPRTLTTMNNLAVGYKAAGKLNLALPLLEDTVKLRKAQLGPDHPDTLASMDNLAKAYLDSNQPNKALPLFAAFVAAQRQRLGARDPRFANLLAAISRDLLKCRQFAEAEKLLREAAAIRQDMQPNLWTTFNTQAMLGASLLGQKKYQDAEPLLLEGYQGMKQREKTIPPQGKARLVEAAEYLMQLYQATDRQEQVQKWAAIVVTVDGKVLEAIHDAAGALTLKGELDATVPTLIYQIRLKAGVTYVIDMVSPDPKALDPYLVLQDAERMTLAEDNDSGGNLNARIMFRAPADGVYRLRATSFNGGRGPFTLSVRPKE